MKSSALNNRQSPFLRKTFTTDSKGNDKLEKFHSNANKYQ